LALKEAPYLGTAAAIIPLLESRERMQAMLSPDRIELDQQSKPL
jgi:hypothetical protein